MKKRIKKSVTPELRQGWLSRYEAGETPPKIADSDHFNVRTVRKHVDLARQERDSREARSAVLRGALEQHYHDMYELAQEMESNIITGRPVSMDPQEDRRISALRQHLPRSPLWNNIPKWNRTIEEINELAKSMKDRIETELKQDEQVLGIDSQIRDRFISGLIAALNSQVDQWVTGSPGLDLDIHIYIEPDSESGHVICYGKNRISPLSKEQAERYEPAVRDIIRRVESDGKETDEFGKIEKLNIQIDNLKRRIRDELAVIIMRRVVPGRCRYCPL